MPCSKLGLIIAGAETDSSYGGYGYASYYGRPEPGTRTEAILKPRRKGGEKAVG